MRVRRAGGWLGFGASCGILWEGCQTRDSRVVSDGCIFLRGKD
jgi:hypothetical protein